MSYEGYTEYLSEKGYYSTTDCWERTPLEINGDPVKYYHHVDITNGEIEGDPGTYPAEKETVGFEDVWQKDHYGNKYATKVPLYKPVSTEWRDFNTNLSFSSD